MQSERERAREQVRRSPQDVIAWVILAEAELDAGDAAAGEAAARRALALRPAGPFAWRESPAGSLVFERQDLVCAVNVDGEPLPLPEGALLLASEPIGSELPPGTAVWVRL